MASGNEKAIVARFQEMRAELTQIWNKITELDMERNEHTLVLNAIKPLDASRKCFRLIGGVLVERTVGEVLPAVTRNKEGIEQVMSHLTDQLETKKKELNDFQVKYNIRVKGDEGVINDSGGAGPSVAAKQGVLVG